MTVAFASDHAGVGLKKWLIDELKKDGHEIIDLGTNDNKTPVDYPDYARKIGEAVLNATAERGVLVCGSGVGASVAANKIKGIRAGLAHDTYSAHQGVEHDDINVLCLGARVIGVAPALECAKAFLGAQFSGEERHMRRLEKVKDIEEHGK